VSGLVHVVGAGVAGLAAALEAARGGAMVRLHEASPMAGGRCRTLRPADGFAHDNGTHVLFTGNGRALRFLEACGARDGWIEPEPGGLPLYDAETGHLSRVGLSPASWRDPALRPPGLGWRDLARLARLALLPGDRSVASLAGKGPLLRNLLEPLTVAVLNTPVETASARRLALALRRLGRPGAARLLVAREGLGPDLVEPALRRLTQAGAAVAFGARLKGLETQDGRASALVFASGRLGLAPEDRVVLALPPWEAARLLPGMPVPERHEAILNVHYRMPGLDRPRFVGFLGTLAQWALVRRDHVSVTVSAAGEAADLDPDAVAARVWGEIAPALRLIGVEAGPEPDARVVKERRATLRQDAGLRDFRGTSGLANVAVAGDWVGSLPATIESAVIAGEEAVRALLGARAAPRPAAAGLPSPEASR
jgi:phytoene dehydrogenase-like protein